MSDKNLLLDKLSADDRTALSRLLVDVSLARQAVLHEPLEEIEFVYFFESGLSSEISLDTHGERVEVGCVGREGFSGVPLVLGVGRTSHRAFMEVGGTAKRLAKADLVRFMEEAPTFRTLMLRYVHTFMIQTAGTALANGRYEIEARLARWILMAHDRLISDELALTHEFLSLMLGVRRSSVTDAIHILEGNRLIKATRGMIQVRDRRGLEVTAGGCYGTPEAEYERVIGRSMRAPASGEKIQA